MRRNHTNPLGRLAQVAILAIPLSATAQVDANQPVIVEFTDGRAARGEVDSRTDDQQLWLRREEAGMQLRSGYAWGRIVRAQVAGRVVSRHELRQLVPASATPGKPAREIAAYPPVPGDAEMLGESSLPVPARQPAARVVALRIVALPGQWNDDARSDGLWVVIYPLSQDGEVVPVNGQLELQLLCEVEPTLIGRAGPPQFRELSRSYEMVRVRDFARGSAVYQLPFRLVHPDFAFDIATPALVHARLGVPGQGVFEASIADVPLRECSRLRDQLQLHTQQRFFPAENVLPRVR